MCVWPRIGQFVSCARWRLKQNSQWPPEMCEVGAVDLQCRRLTEPARVLPNPGPDANEITLRRWM